jgi:hypothetical protein
LRGVDCAAAMQAAPEEEGQHGRVYPFHDTEGDAVCSVANGAGAALLLKRFKPGPRRSHPSCSFPHQPFVGCYDFPARCIVNMQASSEIGWAGLKVEDGAVDAAAAEVDMKQEGFESEEDEDVSEGQLAPLEEMFHLLRCRDVAQVRFVRT